MNLKKYLVKKVIENRNYSGFNILNSETLEIFKVISNGKYLINGFTNKMIRKEIFDDDSESKYIQNKTTRLLAKLKAYGIIKKISKKNFFKPHKNGWALLCKNIQFLVFY